MKYIDIDAFRTTPLIKKPFPYLILPNFIKSDELATVVAEYPAVPGPGSYPNEMLSISPTFQTLLNEFQSDEFRCAVSDKLSLDLSDKPTMTTIRGHCRRTDGKIHRDGNSKIVTFLLYMNPTWEHEEGQLRLLENDHNLNAIIEEIPPLAGTLLMFEVTPNSWHGHTSYEGPRRAIQMNYVTSQAAIIKASSRHHWSAFFKKWKRFFAHEKK